MSLSADNSTTWVNRHLRLRAGRVVTGENQELLGKSCLNQGFSQTFYKVRGLWSPNLVQRGTARELVLQQNLHDDLKCHLSEIYFVAGMIHLILMTVLCQVFYRQSHCCDFHWRHCDLPKVIGKWQRKDSGQCSLAPNSVCLTLYRPAFHLQSYCL